jgi:type I restriction enzyme, S subunit
VTLGSPELRAHASTWYGEIPSDWNVGRFKYIATIRNGQVNPEDIRYKDLPLFAPNHIESGTGRLLDVESADQQGAESGKYIVEAGEIVYSKIRPGLRKVIVAPFQGLCSADMYPVKPISHVVARYLYYSMLSEGFSQYTLLESERVAMPKINREALGECIFVFPERKRQLTIALFLDRKTASVDALIAKKNRLIELLRERRQALITQAATMGMDRNAKVKPSGSPWFELLPDGWQTVTVRYLLSGIEQGWSPACESRPADRDSWGVLKAGCTANGVYRWSENKALPVDETPRPDIEVKPGDLVMSRASGSRHIVGSCAIATTCEPRLMLSDKVFRLRPNAKKIDRTFFWLALASRPARAQIELSISGAEGLANNLPQSELRKVVLAIPPLPQQRRIADEATQGLQHIDKSIQLEERSVERLSEYRQALITAAVTGKIDVSKEPG